MSRQLNLYNPALRSVREFFNARTLLIGIAAVVVLSIGASSWLTYQGIGRDNRVRTLDQQLAKLREESAALSSSLAARGKNTELEQRLQQLEALAKGREQIAASLARGSGDRAGGFAEYMRAFARQTLSGVWLTGFAIGAEGSELTISGRALNPDLVPAYIARLNREPLLQGRKFAQFAVKQPAAGRPQPVPAAGAAQSGMPAAAFHEFRLVSSLAGGTAREGETE